MNNEEYIAYNTIMNPGWIMFCIATPDLSYWYLIPLFAMCYIVVYWIKLCRKL